MTPPGVTFDLAALPRTGSHVYVEKPFTNLRDAEALVALAGEKPGHRRSRRSP
jgi:predicted dehydrogenase